MPGVEIELKEVDFITVGTVGPKGRRVFYLQAGHNQQLVSLIIEKEQSWALSEAITELIEDLDKRYEMQTSEHDIDLEQVDMELREPIDPIFRVSQMGLGYDEDRNMIVLVAQELVVQDPDEADLLSSESQPDPGVVRIWCSPDQMHALSVQAMHTVKSGRADPKQNGRLVYYWT